MKKILIIIALILAGYFVLKFSVLEKPFKYRDINLGWAKTSLPFSLWKNPQASLMQHILNEDSSSQKLRHTELLVSVYDKKKFSLMVVYAELANASEIHPKRDLANLISNAGFKKEAKQVFRQAQRTKENGAVKYTFQSATNVQNVPILLVAINCTKGNKTANFFGVGRDLPENKEIIDRFLAATECFPEKK